MINASPTPNEKPPNIATFSFWFSDQLAQLLHTSAVITIIQSLGLLFLCGLMLITWQEEDVFIWKSLKYNFRKSGGLKKGGKKPTFPTSNIGREEPKRRGSGTFLHVNDSSVAKYFPMNGIINEMLCNTTQNIGRCGLIFKFAALRPACK